MGIYNMLASASIWAEKNPVWANILKHAAAASLAGGVIGAIAAPPDGRGSGFMTGAFIGGGIGAGAMLARHYAPNVLGKIAANRMIGGIATG